MLRRAADVMSKAVVSLISTAYPAREQSADLILVLIPASPLLHGGLQGKSQNAAFASSKFSCNQSGPFLESLNIALP